MINTIFYFPDKNEINFEEYYSRLDQSENGILGRTIVFNPGNGEDGSGEIWKNGQRYSYSKDSIESWVNGWIQSYLQQAGITAIDLSQYAKKSWVNEQNFVKESQIGNVFKDATYVNGKLKFTRWNGVQSPEFTIGGGDVNLNQPLSGINNAGLSTPSNGQGLVYENNRWQYKSYGSGGATYNQGVGITINDNTISLKPASANEIGGIITNGTFSSAEKKYPVETNSSGQAYVQVPWQSNQIVGEYLITVQPQEFSIVTDENGLSKATTVNCSVNVTLNGVGQAFNVAFNNTPNGVSTSWSAANKTITIGIQAGIQIAGQSISIPVTITPNGQESSTFYIRGVGLAAAQNGADAVSLLLSTYEVRLDWERAQAYPSSITTSVQKGQTALTTIESITSAHYIIYYKYDSGDWNHLSDTTQISISNRQANTMYIELRSGDNPLDRTANALVDFKTIPFIVDQRPSIGYTGYKIQVLSTTVGQKYDPEEDFTLNGTIRFKILNGSDVYLTDSTINANSNPKLSIKIGDSTAHFDTLGDRENLTFYYDQSHGYWEVRVETQLYEENYKYSIIQLIDGANHVLDSVIIPFILEGADGQPGQDGAVQGLSGTVLRIIPCNNEQEVIQHGDWYTGNRAIDGVLYMDILEYQGGYYRKRGNTGTVQRAPIFTSGNSSYVNYTVNNTNLDDQQPGDSIKPNNWPEWAAFTTFTDAAFHTLLSKYAFIENLTGREIVITDDNQNPTAGITSGESVATEDSSAIDGIYRGDIRIWAGYPNSGNLYNCPFYVTDTGELHSTSGYFENVTIKNSVILPKTVKVDMTNYTNYGVYAYKIIRDNNGPLIDGNDNRYNFVMNYDIWVETGTFSETNYDDFSIILPPAEYAKGRVFEFIFGFRRNTTHEKLNVPVNFKVLDTAIKPTVDGTNQTVQVDVDESYWRAKDTNDNGWLNLFTTVTTVAQNTIENNQYREMPVGNHQNLLLKPYDKIRIASMENPYSEGAVDNDHGNRPHYSWVLLSAD